MKKTKEIAMNPMIQKIIDRLKDGMIDFMSDGEASYTEKDVVKCIRIITDYLDSMAKSTSMDEGMNVVKKAILALNQLNESREYELIETDQREDICEIFIIAGSKKGYNELDDDITEEWREW